MKKYPGFQAFKHFSRLIPLYVLSVFFLSSCSNFFFENPQPAGQPNLKEFPKKLLGAYKEIEKEDTMVVIYPDGFKMNLNGNDVKIPLSEKTILRKYKSLYFVSLKGEEDNLWTVYIVKPAKKKTLDFYTLSTDMVPMEKLKAITKVKTKEDSDGKYIINPGLEEMDKIIETGLLQPTKKLKK